MLRTALPLFALLLLAACASTPPGGSSMSAREKSKGTHITVSRAYAPPPGFPHFVDHSIGREEISIEAMALVGVPYRWGGNTPDSGFDCSGLVRYVVSRAASVNLPRVTADMSERGVSIDPDEIAPGDLIFFNTTGRAHSHVGIYVGKLRFVNAPSTGGTVRIDYLTNPYWASRFDGIRRVATPQDVPVPNDAPVAVPVYAERSAPSRTVEAPAPASAAAPVVPSYAAATPRAVSAPAPVPAAADAYEPPPGYTPPSNAVPATQQAATVPTPATPAATSTAAPDPIDAAADAFEPPPPAATAAARQAQDVESGNFSAAARASSSDDPIASFAGANN
jgi:hypothetical protein